MKGVVCGGRVRAGDGVVVGSSVKLYTVVMVMVVILVDGYRKLPPRM